MRPGVGPPALGGQEVLITHPPPVAVPTCDVEPPTPHHTRDKYSYCNCKKNDGCYPTQVLFRVGRGGSWYGSIRIEREKEKDDSIRPAEPSLQKRGGSKGGGGE